MFTKDATPMGALIDWEQIARLKLAYEQRMLGGKRRRGNESEKARKHGISKAFRQYARRHGKSIDDILQTHAKFPALTLDHWRDRGEALRRAMREPR